MGGKNDHSKVVALQRKSFGGLWKEGTATGWWSVGEEREVEMKDKSFRLGFLWPRKEIG